MPGQNSQDPTPGSVTKQQGPLVKPEAAPREVAGVALKAIVAKDMEALTSLVAVKRVQKDIESITRGRSAFQGMVDKAIPNAFAAITSEIHGLDADGREIEQKTVNGNNAVVKVKGKRNGEEQTRRFFLVQEDNQWRLVPSQAL